jgi:hypothetical protein
MCSPCRFTPWDKKPGAHWIGGRVYPRVGLGSMGKIKILHSRESNPGRPHHSPSLSPLLEVPNCYDADVFHCSELNLAAPKYSAVYINRLLSEVCRAAVKSVCTQGYCFLQEAFRLAVKQCTGDPYSRVLTCLVLIVSGLSPGQTLICLPINTYCVYRHVFLPLTTNESLGGYTAGDWDTLNCPVKWILTFPLL